MHIVTVTYNSLDHVIYVAIDLLYLSNDKCYNQFYPTAYDTSSTVSVVNSRSANTSLLTNWLISLFNKLTYCIFLLFTLILFCILYAVIEMAQFLVYLLNSVLTLLQWSTPILSKLTIACYSGEHHVAEYMLLFWLFFLLSSISAFFFYLFTGLRGFIIMNIIGILPFWLLSTYLFEWFVICENTVTFLIGEFNVVGIDKRQPLRLSMNKLTFGFGYLTLSIGLFVLLYSFFYFRGEPTTERLSYLLMLFVNSMLILLYSDNLIIMFIGWEMIGVTSFFLINYWSTRVDTLKSAMKALVFNLFSDGLLLLSLIMIAKVYRTLDIPTLNELAPSSLDTTLSFGHVNLCGSSIISILLLIAASIKSAQFILHAWLPDSMEAPAPASALIHSATLVSAGIFILTRLNSLWVGTCLPLPGISIYIKDVIILWGSLTAAYGGVVSSRQTDLKKILAYSTISHCGYMMVLVGCGSIDSLLFYFYIHGLFKALLFLITGNIMRHYQNQDFRKMGNAWSILPFETSICIFSFAHLSGAPFSLGYVAKHSVLTLSPHAGLYGTVVVSLLILGACASVFYSLEFLRCVFFEPVKSTMSISCSKLDSNYFSKFNNPTGNIGLLVIGLYYIYASFIGYYLSAHLVDYTQLSMQLDPYDYTTNIPNSKTLPIYGYSVLSIPTLTCYSIIITLLLYITSSTKVESNGPQLLVWLLVLVLFFHIIVSVYNISMSPITVFESLITSVLDFSNITLVTQGILFMVDSTLSLFTSQRSIVTYTWLN